MRALAGGVAHVRATAAAAVAVVLAATSVHAVLTTHRWFWPAVLAVTVVAVVGALVRRLRLPVALHPLLALAALLLLLTGTYAGHQAFAGFLPTYASLRRLSTLAGDGASDLSSLLMPTYPTPQLELLAVGAVGLVALAVDLIAVSGRRPAFAGVPLILLVAVPAGIRERSVGYASLFAAGAGFLLLLTLDGDDRTRRWGRVLPSARDGSSGLSATGTTGPALRIGVVALLAAAAVPFVVPGAHVSRFAAAGDGPGAGGTGRAVIVDPLVTIATELNQQTSQPLLTVRSSVPTYQRITALESFNDGGFSLGTISAPTSARVSDGLTPPAYTVQSTEVTQKLTASDTLAQSLLPVPQGTRTVAIHGDWRLDAQTRTIFSASTNTRGATWSVTADLPDPNPRTLQAGGLLHRPAGDFPSYLAIDLQVPDLLPPEVAATARAWTAGASTAYEAAVDIQQHFTSGAFTYDQDVSYQNGPAGFVQFLTDRRGFCEQFATTMAAMMRTLGVPARVAIGFTAGTPNAGHDVWTITGADAHAWPEVWFDHVGWVRFEPTPLTGGRAITPAYTEGGAGGRGGISTGPPTVPTVPAPGASASQPAKLDRLDASHGGGGAALGRGGSGGVVGWVWGGVGVLVLLALLSAPLCADRLARRRRLSPGGSVELVWRQLLDDAADRLVPVRAPDSPRMAGRRLRAVLESSAHAGPAVVGALGRLVAAVEQARYAPGPPADTGGSLAADEHTVRRALSAGLPWTDRVVAAVAPASARARLLAPLTRGGLATLAGLDRMARLFAGRRPASSG